MSQSSAKQASDLDKSPERILCISPNNSLSLSQARIFFVSLIAATLVVSGSIALQGFWLVLPFAGLELFAIGMALHVSLKRGRYQEVLRLSESQLVVEKGAQKIEERVEFPRYWATINLIPSRVSSYPSRLLIGYKGRSLEIGACLTETERLGLGKKLMRLVGPVESSPRLSSTHTF